MRTTSGSDPDHQADRRSGQGEDTPTQSPGPGGAEPSAPAARPKASLIFDDPLDRASRDDTDLGWGERSAAGNSAADLARFLDEKPPHHL